MFKTLTVPEIKTFSLKRKNETAFFSDPKFGALIIGLAFISQSSILKNWRKNKNPNI
jgi:hypothetical protein